MAPSRRLRTIIVEDEESPRELLKRLLERRHSEQIELVGEAETGPQGLALCEETQPDLMFLDLQLPGLHGLELLEALAPLRTETHVVITTGDPKRAVDAYRANAVDYLLKPIDPEQLREAVSRVATAIANERVVRLLCRDRDETKVVDLDDVLFMRAEDGYTNVQTENAYYLLNESLIALEERLPSNFVRVHRTTIVNVRHVTGIGKGGDAALLGKEGHSVNVGRRQLREFRRRLIYVK
jgi:DNA-binding LytR/AlgR family response regulator